MPSLFDILPFSRAVARGDRAATHRQFLATTHFPSLDGLRCLAILPVVWHHSTPRPLEGVLGRGPLGVDLFFAVSGFLITTLLLREQRATGRISLAKFYARRSLRIFPLYYIVLAIFTAWAAWLEPATSPVRAHFFRSLPAYATYTTNWLVDFSVPHAVLFSFSWSLATEEQFYLVWPGIMKLARRWWWPAAFMAALLVVDQTADFGLLSRVLDWRGLPFRIIASVAAPICMGALLAYGLHGERSFGALRTLLGHRISAPLALAFLATLIAWDAAPLWAIHLAMTLLVGTTCVRQDHGLQPLTDAAPLRYVGNISYGMYLFHVSSIGLVKRALPDALRETSIVFALGLMLTLVLAHLSYRFVERPLLGLRQRFRSAPTPRIS